MHTMDQYERVKFLGDGGCGVVSLFKHKLSRLEYAIKKVDEDAMERMFRKSTAEFREVEILWKCLSTNSPHTIEIVETFKDIKNFRHRYIVTKYSKGGDLLNLMEQLHKNVVSEMTLKKLVR